MNSKNFLRDVQRWSRTLVYDWSDGGDAEVVVEDIENTELDMIEIYDDQQKEWRFHDEQGAAFQRNRYTNHKRVYEKMATFRVLEMEFNDILLPTVEDTNAMEDVYRFLPSQAYSVGANAHLGDDTSMLTLFGLNSKQHKQYRKLEGQFYFEWTAATTKLEKVGLVKGDHSLNELKKSKSAQ